MAEDRLGRRIARWLKRTDLTPEQRHKLELGQKVNRGSATQEEVEEFNRIVAELSSSGRGEA